MTDELTDREYEDCWSDSVETIALEFEVPRATAASWERNIGDVGALQESLGRYGPDNYLELLRRRRREWLPREREKREEEWVDSLKRWCTRKADGVYLVHESEREDFRSEHRAVGMQSMSLGSEWRAVALTDGSTKRREVGAVSGMTRTEEMAALREELERKEERVKYDLRRVDSEWIGLTGELRRVEKFV
ncbi:hypothetical protein [Natrinema salaciae]|uniref:Uncharacterized protein n=1 Tax=Natrinema salaciae TaxID=1186196 RepID=A0A1H9P3Z3_9EURY|nr:hypothetical protein [Natrinema salaciae]SER42777.1 hypothetical protein SAMN04489841_3850 [Natrinema salaciae]